MTATSGFADLDRPPLPAAVLAASLTRSGGLWREVRVLAQTDSTNAVVASAARAGAAEGLVVAAEWQSAGRGRLGRTWTAPPRAALTFSVLLRPDPVPAARRGLVPLLAGVALARAVGAAAVLDARLKWPNDLLLGPQRRKAAGVLAESAGDAVVVGIGLNVLTRADELPRPDATSLLLEGAAVTDRLTVLRAVLRALEQEYVPWRDSGGAPESLLAAYRQLCDTVGRPVRVEMPGGEVVEGLARDVDEDGGLVVSAASGVRVVRAGDVVHVRAGSEMRGRRE